MGALADCLRNPEMGWEFVCQVRKSPYGSTHERLAELQAIKRLPEAIRSSEEFLGHLNRCISQIQDLARGHVLSSQLVGQERPMSCGFAEMLRADHPRNDYSRASVGNQRRKIETNVRTMGALEDYRVMVQLLQNYINALKSRRTARAWGRRVQKLSELEYNYRYTSRERAASIGQSDSRARRREAEPR